MHDPLPDSTPHAARRRALVAALCATPALPWLAGCTAVEPAATASPVGPLLGVLNPTTGADRSDQREVASLLSFLYPGKEPPTAAPQAVTELKVPFRVGIAFVPDSAPQARQASFALPETERRQLADRVREAFKGYPFIREIELVPSSFLQPGGGFDNLDRVAALMRVEVVVLISFDQLQHKAANRWSFLYWTGLGAYVVKGERYDIFTSLDVSVFDVKSRRMLMHAGGRSTVKGDATWVGFAERSRSARQRSFEQALGEMNTALHGEIAAFRARAQNDPTIRLILPPGYVLPGAEAR
jgi:rhombotail lipoprotein